MRKQKDPARFETLENGCMVIINRKLNADGYYRVKRKATGLIMFHRLKWEQENGPIPEGYEINHKCKNRACCNLEHLEVIEGSKHATQSNLERDFKLGEWKTNSARPVDTEVRSVCRRPEPEKDWDGNGN